MGLKLNIKPGERFFIGTSEVLVVSEHITTIIVEGTAPVLRAEDHIAEVEALTPPLRLRYLIQQIYLSQDIAAFHHDYFEQAQALCQNQPEWAALVAEINGLLIQGQTYKAVRLAKTLGSAEATPSGLRLVQR